MQHTLKTSWKGKMLFDADMNGEHVLMDAPSESGGEGRGVRPKQLMLASLAGCTGIDVVSILSKMRVELDSFDIEIEANLTDEFPKHYDKMHVIYIFGGKDLPMDKLEKAVELSKERYCGVSYVYGKAMELTHEIRLV